MIYTKWYILIKKVDMLSASGIKTWTLMTEFGHTSSTSKSVNEQVVSYVQTQNTIDLC